MYWEFYNTNLSLWNTLGMSGWWYFEKYKHNNLSFKIGKTKVYFNDYINFVTFKICNSINLEKKLNCLGPDIFNKNNELKQFRQRLERKRNNTYIGSALLDQKVISGIGNYLRADLLWKSRISPFRKISDLSDKETKLIYNNAKILANRFYKLNNRINDEDLYHPSYGEHYFLVYGLEYDKYGNKVIKEKIGNRTIHWVPQVQK